MGKNTGAKKLVSKGIVIILLVIAIFLSVSASYIAITKNDLTELLEVNTASVGLFVEPTRDANVGVKVLPPDKGEG
jgi:hypothetical protein